MGKTVRVRSPLPAPIKQAYIGAANILLSKVYSSVKGHWYRRSKNDGRIQLWIGQYNPEWIFYQVFIGQSNVNFIIVHGCGDENCFNPTHLIEGEYPVKVSQDDT